MDTTPRRRYPADVTDDEWAFSALYLTLMREYAPQRCHDLRELFNGLLHRPDRFPVGRFMPTDLPPWHAVYQQTRRWIDAGVFETIIGDLRALIRLGEGRAPQLSAIILDSRTLQSTPESGPRAGWDGAKRRKGTKVHLAVDTLGYLLALHVTPANAQDRAQVAEIAAAVQAVTGETVGRPTWTRATPGRGRSRQRLSTAFSWRSSSCPPPSAGSSCCRAAGWSSGTSAG